MEEYLDVLDENGNPTGRTKLKSEIHRDGDWHKTVHIWIINHKGELLIQKKSPDDYNFSNLFDISSAGHISAGEKSVDAAMREIGEELGLNIPEKNFEYLFTVAQKYRSDKLAYINNEFGDVYLIKMELDSSKLKLQKEELAEVKFMHYKELEKIISENNKEFIPHPEEYEKLFEKLRTLNF